MTPVPTSWDDWRLLLRTTRLVLGHPSYAAIAILTGVLAAIGMAVSLHLQFVLAVLPSESVSGQLKLGLVTSLLPFLGTQDGAVVGLALYAIAALTGAAIAVLACYRIEQGDPATSSGDGSVAVAVTLLGVACVACGPAILAGIAGVLGLDGLLATLPFHGLEFSMLATAVLVLSTYRLAEELCGGEIRGRPVEPERG